VNLPGFLWIRRADNYRGVSRMKKNLLVSICSLAFIFCPLLVAFAGPPVLYKVVGTNEGRFNFIGKSATDSAGNIYIADSGNERVQKFDAAGNFLMFLGGNGTAPGQFLYPRGIKVDNQDNLFVADNKRVHKFSSAGLPLYSFETSGYMCALDLDSLGHIYVLEGAYLAKYDGAGTLIWKIGGTGSGPGQFSGPQGLSIGPDGIIYVADSQRIQKIDSNGNYLGQQSFGTAVFDVNVDQNGLIYVADHYQMKIIILDPQGQFIKEIGAGYYTVSVTVDAAGNIYVTNYDDSLIKMDFDGNHLLSIGSNGGNPDEFGKPKLLSKDSAGNIYVADQATRADWYFYAANSAHLADHRIRKLDTNGNMSLTFGRNSFDPGAFTEGPVDIVVDSFGSIFVNGRNKRNADLGIVEDVVQKFDSAGHFISDFQIYTDTNHLSQGMGIDSGENIYIGDVVTGKISKFSKSGQWLGEFLTDNPPYPPWDLEISDDNQIVVISAWLGYVLRFDQDGNLLSKFMPAVESKFLNAYGLDVDEDGNIWVADTYNHRVLCFSTDGSFLFQFGRQGFNPGEFQFPTDVAVANGRVFVSDTSNQRIQMFLIPGYGVDMDSDGLDDAWEMTHFGSLDANPGDDPDGDGLSNLQESQQGTDPNNPDTQPPTSELTDPVPGATNAPIGTNIVVHIRDGEGAVNPGAIVMKVSAVVVFNGANPTAYPNTVISGGPSNYSLTYNPPADFGYEQTVTVTVSAMDAAGNALSGDTHSFMTEAQSGNPWDPAGDDDADDIPNGVERDLLKTDLAKKTLFIRPKMWSGSQFVYWPGFKDLFPDARGAGFADIPAFTNAGIEISVIGDPGHPYAPMSAFSYDPATDANHPPCDIVEIVYMPDNAYCSQGSYNFGHTYFFTSSAAWYWDTKGYVPNAPTAYNYFTAYIYPLAVDTYLTEGAYPSISDNAEPITTLDCGLNQCYETTHASPLNLNAVNPTTGTPDATVEFNEIVFDVDKNITFVGATGTEYDRNAVMRRTIAHELGHTLMAASENDHCSEPQCIMYNSTADWEMRDFGPGSSCIHSPGGSKDIRSKGVVHNSAHY
jgi:tripartite motif-containing protein 71